MASSTPPNLVENSNNLSLAVGGEHWTFSTQEDKYLCLVEDCKSKGYGAKNHFRKHMLGHNLHIAWDNPGRPKKTIGKSRIQNSKKYNALVLSDEMAKKQKKLNQHERKWFKEATKAWDTLNSLEVVHSNKEKLVLALMLDPVLDRFLGIQKWGHHISPVRFNGLITGTEFAEYLRSTKGITSVKPLKQAWGKVM